jgi:predicted RNase H-like HicB family nuclease
VSRVARIRVDYVWDNEAGSWGFVVPALHIVGGGPTREDARRRAREAIAFALEAGEGDEDTSDAEYLDVKVG